MLQGLVKAVTAIGLLAAFGLLTYHDSSNRSAVSSMQQQRFEMPVSTFNNVLMPRPVVDDDEDGKNTPPFVGSMAPAKLDMKSPPLGAVVPEREDSPQSLDTARALIGSRRPKPEVPGKYLPGRSGGFAPKTTAPVAADAARAPASAFAPAEYTAVGPSAARPLPDVSPPAQQQKKELKQQEEHGQPRAPQHEAPPRSPAAAARAEKGPADAPGLTKKEKRAADAAQTAARRGLGGAGEGGKAAPAVSKPWSGSCDANQKPVFGMLKVVSEITKVTPPPPLARQRV